MRSLEQFPKTFKEKAGGLCGFRGEYLNGIAMAVFGYEL